MAKDLTGKRAESVKGILVRFNEKTLDNLDVLCEELGVTRTEYIRVVVARAIKQDTNEQK